VKASGGPPSIYHDGVWSRSNRVSLEIRQLTNRFDVRSTALHAFDKREHQTRGEFDTGAVLKYGAALAIQMTLFFIAFTGLDVMVVNFGVEVPFIANCFLFYVAALKSRALNPLANNRPQPKNLEIDGLQRRMPTWTPPGIVFPIVWLLIIGPIRAVSSAMIYKTTGSYAVPAILSLALHLSIGDIWNTINNVERRYGVAVFGVLCVWLSKAFAAYEFFRVNQMAGKVLGLTLVWLTVASALVTRTWQLNPDPTTGKAEPLFPIKGKTKTKLAWFSDLKGEQK
jgi:benzodiazapine receptor